MRNPIAVLATSSFAALAAVVIAVLLLATACGGGSVGETYDDNDSADYADDPRDGWVQLDEDTYKKCDGANLLYYNDYDGSIAISPADPTCADSTLSPSPSPTDYDPYGDDD